MYFTSLSKACNRTQMYSTLQLRILFNRLGVLSRICRNSWVNSTNERQISQNTLYCTAKLLFSLLHICKADFYLPKIKRFTKYKAIIQRVGYNTSLIGKNAYNVKKIDPVLPSSSSRVTELSTYSHQCFPSVETGISQFDHLQARWMQTQAITVGLYWRQKVVRCRLCVFQCVYKSEYMRYVRSVFVSWFRTGVGHNWFHMLRKEKGKNTRGSKQL